MSEPKKPGQRRPDDEMERTHSVDEAAEAELRKFASSLKDEFFREASPMERSIPVPRAVPPQVRQAAARAKEETKLVDEAEEAELRKFAATMKDEMRRAASSGDIPIEKVAGRPSGEVPGPLARRPAEMENTASVDTAAAAELRQLAATMKDEIRRAAATGDLPVDKIAGPSAAPSAPRTPSEMERTKTVDAAAEAELRRFAAQMKQDFAGKPAPRRPLDEMEKTTGMDDAMQRELERFAESLDLGEDDLPRQG